MTDTKFALIRNAKIDVTQVATPNGNHAEIVINDTWQHRFPTASRVSKHLDLMTPQTLGERLSGGSFFVVEDQLVDFRDGQYHGFQHTDHTLENFMSVLGVQHKNQLGRHRRSTAAVDIIEDSPIILSKKWSDHNITVPGYSGGADFASELSFTWNPFVKSINSSFDLVRLICENGMVGLTPFLNTKIPLVNRWEEHLHIASTQIQNKVNAIVYGRIGSMNTERASVADVILIEQHITHRLQSGGEKQPGERDMLVSMLAAVAPIHHLSNVYQFSVFQDKNLASHLPSHLSNFDMYNVATELRTHTTQNSKSSNHALDRFSNGLMFDTDINSIASARTSTRSTSTFSSPEQAFWGRVTA